MENLREIKTTAPARVVPDFSAVIFSFNGHQANLVPLLSQIKQYVFNYRDIVVVWDDYVHWEPVNFDIIKTRTDCDFRVIYQSEIYDWPETIGEWGWIKQQLAKLLCYTYVEGPFSWICDGDITIIKDLHLFSPNNKPLIRESIVSINENDGYYKTIKKFFDIKKLHPFVLMNGGGNGIFDHEILKNLFNHCQQKNGIDLVQCINSIISPGGPVKNHYNLHPFSEFETYSNFAYQFHKDRFLISGPNWEDKANWPYISPDTQILI